MANNGLVISVKRFKMADSTKFNKSFFLLKSISKKRNAFCFQTPKTIANKLEAD